jgi:hypothetical protein
MEGRLWRRLLCVGPQGMLGVRADSLIIMASDLCRAFQTQARRISRLLGKGDVAGVRIAEETLTNLLLVHLSLLRSSAFDIAGFSKADEAILGADWEMWIGGYSGRWLACRIQAKVLNPKTKAFDHLHYRKDTTSPYQCDTLIAAASAPLPRRIPLYLLYTRVRGSRALLNWQCSAVPFNRELFGCSLVAADTVRALRSGMRRSLRDLLPSMWPWHCLVCASPQGKDLAIRARNWLAQQVTAAQVREEVGVDAPDDADLTREVPAYVDAVLEGLPPELPADLAGLLVIRQLSEAA